MPPPTHTHRQPGSPLKLLSMTPAPSDTDSDVMLAQMLQLEFDREHDHRIKAEEKHYNKHNKGDTISFCMCVVTLSASVCARVCVCGQVVKWIGLL